jgi:hypothetical protein
MLARLVQGADDAAQVAAHGGLRADAAQQVRSIAAGLAADALPALRPRSIWRSRLPTPVLAAVGLDDAARAAHDLRGLMRWTDDGACYARAVVGARRVEQLLAGGGVGAADARRAAVAVVGTSHRRTGWTYHAATAIRTSDDGGIRVIDHLLGARTGRSSGLFTVDEWAGHVGRRASQVRIQDVLDNVPTGSGPLTAPATARTMRRFGAWLEQSIARA